MPRQSKFVSWDMLFRYAKWFALTTTSLENCRVHLAKKITEYGQDKPLNASDELGVRITEDLVRAHALCSAVPSLNLVTLEIDRLSVKLSSNTMRLDSLSNDIEHLLNRIFDELDSHFYFAVTVPYAAIYEAAFPFGEEVFNNFPSAIKDIQNAGKCLALGQATATVFHLMRVMEVGLRVLSRALRIPHAPNWDSHIKGIQKKIEEKHNQKKPAWKKQEALFRDICGDLTSIKMAWRNPTMHIEQEFSIEEANQIYSAVQTFMKRMATKFKENGKPVAISVALAGQGQP
jgi:hypothetical protein